MERMGLIRTERLLWKRPRSVTTQLFMVGSVLSLLPIPTLLVSFSHLRGPEVHYNVLIVSFASVLIGFLLCFAFFRRISLRLHVLRDDIKQIEKTGDLSLPIRFLGDDEVGVIASSFENIRKDLVAAQTTLSDNNARIRGIVDTAVDAIITIDHEGIIEFINPAFEKVFQYKSEEVLGRNIKLLMPEPYSSEHDAYLRRFFKTGEQKIIGIGREIEAQRKDGTLFPIDLAVSEVTLDGRTVFTGIIRDISERKLEQKKFVEQQNLAKLGELSAVVAHEVKNPLAAIISGSRMLQRRLSDKSEERDICEEMIRRTLALNETVKHILLYSRPYTFERKSTSMNALVSEVLASLADDPEFEQIEITCVLPETLVSCDPDLMRSVFLNLFQNAAQAMQGKGTIKISQADPGSEGYFVITVSDSGSGIDPDLSEKVFEPFFSMKSGGTGLGLPIVKRIVELHGGSVSLRRSAMEGLEVVVLLPMPSDTIEESISEQKKWLNTMS